MPMSLPRGVPKTVHEACPENSAEWSVVCLIFVIESPRTDLKTHLSHDTLVSVSEGDEMRFTPFLYPES